MSDIKLVRSHSLPITKARALAQKAADDLAAAYDLSSEWHGNTLRFHRLGVAGQMHVTDEEIRLDVTLGFLLKAFKARFVENIERSFDTLLAGREGKTPAKKRAKKTRARG
jgi:putative polyhydroxyalkanoate system protein